MVEAVGSFQRTEGLVDPGFASGVDLSILQGFPRRVRNLNGAIMSIRRIRRMEVLARAASHDDLPSRGSLFAAATPMRKCCSVPTLVTSGFPGSIPPVSLTPARKTIVPGAGHPPLAGEESRFLKLPAEIGLEVAGHLGHADLLRFRGTSRACKDLADHRLVRTTAARLAIEQEKLDQAESALETVEDATLPMLVLNHRYLNAVNARHLDELRWLRNPSEEIRVVCRCLVALHRGHFAPDYLADRTDGDAARFATWASVRAAMGTPEFRRWIANLRRSADSLPAVVRPADADRNSLGWYAALPESQLLSSGRLWATQIWQTTATGFPRMREVSSPGYHALQFVSAAVHYISLRTALLAARRQRDTTVADIDRVERFRKAIARA